VRGRLIFEPRHRFQAPDGIVQLHRSPTVRIISTPLPAAPSELADNRPTIVMALDTLVHHKSVVVGLVQGVAQGPDLPGLRLSAVGQLVVDRGARHQQLNYPHAPTVIAGVAQVGSAKQRVRQVLAKAPPGAFVLLLCADGKTYDAAYAVLNIQLQAANEQPQ
jgi:hypothetical protein